jgi:hypothetical protein
LLASLFVFLLLIFAHPEVVSKFDANIMIAQNLAYASELERIIWAQVFRCIVHVRMAIWKWKFGSKSEC